MIKNRHFCFFFVVVVWLFALFLLLKSNILKHFYVSLPFFLYFRALARLFYGRFAPFFLVPKTFANVARLRLFTESYTVCGILYYRECTQNKAIPVHFRLHCPKVGDVKDKKNERVRSVTFISPAQPLMTAPC